MKPLAAEHKCEFLVNGEGQALLLHQGALPYSYCWVQFDSYTDSIQFVTETGDIQELGFKLPCSVRSTLWKTREVIMIEVGDDYACKGQVLVVFNNVVN